jgi:hypothetical protein
MARNFPHWLKAYCDYTSASESPLAFHFWTAVSCVSAVLKKRVWRDELIFKWTPNFYIILVAPAGIASKSTSLGLGYNLLRQCKNAKNQELVQFGPDSMTWHGLGKRFEQAAGYEEYTNGTGTTHRVLMSPLTCSVSELGTFLRPDDTGLVSFLTDVWDGKDRPFDHGTKDSGDIKIENPWLNIIGATTPEWMQENFPPGLLSEGLGSRTIFVYADQKRQLTAYPSRLVTAPDHAQKAVRLIEDLQQIGKLGGSYELSPDAYKWGEDWYQRHHQVRGTHVASGRYSGYLARKQTHMHKLAMVLAASQRDDLEITQSDLEEAETLLSTTEQSMIKVFESVGLIDEAKHIAEVVQFVRAYTFITQKDLYRLCHNIMNQRDFAAALRSALEGDLLEVTKLNGQIGVSPKGSRPQSPPTIN